VIMWTVNNEMYFYRDRDAARRLKKWRVVTELIKAMRGLDPSRPVVLDSAYVRSAGSLKEVRANGLDDGDLDDMHRYYGWYAVGPMWLISAMGRL